MDFAALDVREGPEGVTFRVRVQPRASRSAVTGLAGDAVRVALTSPPVEGAANAACAALFAELLRVAKSRVSIVAGLKSRDKTVRVAGVGKAAFFAALATVKFD
ncbi:DUF167 domain-containing protein [Anaeroselena agilis]|uniref:UPF0235 protein Q4T40_09825 n=1 Tax=Anaeroselena agilis TaxID=3063788 RepID=A0ABU3NXK1_9FIRM|nr:DUF167 domain-containing protein [Selenomonadales bacterium 4137-cl]